MFLCVLVRFPCFLLHQGAARTGVILARRDGPRARGPEPWLIVLASQTHFTFSFLGGGGDDGGGHDGKLSASPIRQPTCAGRKYPVRVTPHSDIGDIQHPRGNGTRYQVPGTRYQVPGTWSNQPIIFHWFAINFRVFQGTSSNSNQQKWPRAIK